MDNMIPQEKVDAIQTDLNTMLERGQTLKVMDQPSYQSAATFITEIKVRLKRLEEMRTEITKPLNEALRATNNRFKQFTEPLEKLEKMIKDGMARYAAEEEERARLKFEEEVRIAKEKAARELEEARKKQEEADRLAAEAKNKKQKEEAAKAAEEAAKATKQAEETASKPVQVEKPETAVRTNAGLVHTKKVWTFEILDKDKIPEKFWVVDEKAIRKAIADGDRNIDGLKIYQETQMASRI